MIARFTSANRRTRQSRAALVRPRMAMTLIELILALSITALVATAITAMLHAMSTGVVSKRDSRNLLVRSNAAANRLVAYVDPSRCLLAADDDGVVLWFDDSRESLTVHATEIRWLNYDSTDDAIDVFWVHFPVAWTQAAKDLADLEYLSTANWAQVLADYEAAGYVAQMRLIDGVASVTVDLDQGTAQASRHLTYDLGLTAEDGTQIVRTAATIMHHRTPSS